MAGGDVEAADGSAEGRGRKGAVGSFRSLLVDLAARNPSIVSIELLLMCVEHLGLLSFAVWPVGVSWLDGVTSPFGARPGFDAARSGSLVGATLGGAAVAAVVLSMAWLWLLYVRGQRHRTAWALSWLRPCLHLLSTAALLPLLGSLVPFAFSRARGDPQWDSSSGATSAVGAVAASVAAAVATALAAVTAASYYECDPFGSSPLARPHGRWDVLEVLARAAMVVVTCATPGATDGLDAEGEYPPAAAWSVTVAAVACGGVWTLLPSYYNLALGRVKATLWWVTAWAGAAGLVATYQERGGAAAPVVLYIGWPLAMAVGWLAFNRNLARIREATPEYVYTPFEVELKARLWLVDARAAPSLLSLGLDGALGAGGGGATAGTSAEAAMKMATKNKRLSAASNGGGDAAGCPFVPLAAAQPCAPAAMTDAEAKEALHGRIQRWYAAAGRRFSSSSMLHTFAALFHFNHSRNRQLAASHLLRAREMSALPDELLLAERLNEQHEAILGRGSEELARYLRYCDHVERAQDMDVEASRARLHFWEGVSARVGQTKIVRLGRDLLLARAQARHHYMQALEIDGHSAQLNRTFGSFLADMENDAVQGKRYLTRADERERAATAAREHRLLDGPAAALAKLTGGVDDEERMSPFVEDNAVVVVDHRKFHGEVVRANEGASRMFGYTRSELVGHNVSILVPYPWSDFHDDYLRAYIDTGVEHIINKSRSLFALHKSGHLVPMVIRVRQLTTTSFLAVLHPVPNPPLYCYARADGTVYAWTGQCGASLPALQDVPQDVPGDSVIQDFGEHLRAVDDLVAGGSYAPQPRSARVFTHDGLAEATVVIDPKRARSVSFYIVQINLPSKPQAQPLSPQARARQLQSQLDARDALLRRNPGGDSSSDSDDGERRNGLSSSSSSSSSSSLSSASDGGAKGAGPAPEKTGAAAPPSGATDKSRHGDDKKAPSSAGPAASSAGAEKDGRGGQQQVVPAVAETGSSSAALNTLDVLRRLIVDQESVGRRVFLTLRVLMAVMTLAIATLAITNYVLTASSLGQASSDMGFVGLSCSRSAAAGTIADAATLLGVGESASGAGPGEMEWAARVAPLKVGELQLLQEELYLGTRLDLGSTQLDMLARPLVPIVEPLTEGGAATEGSVWTLQQVVASVGAKARRLLANLAASPQLAVGQIVDFYRLNADGAIHESLRRSTAERVEAARATCSSGTQLQTALSAASLAVSVAVLLLVGPVVTQLQRRNSESIRYLQSLPRSAVVSLVASSRERVESLGGVVSSSHHGAFGQGDMSAQADDPDVGGGGRGRGGGGSRSNLTGEPSKLSSTGHRSAAEARDRYRSIAALSLVLLSASSFFWITLPYAVGTRAYVVSVFSTISNSAAEPMFAGDEILTVQRLVSAERDLVTAAAAGDAAAFASAHARVDGLLAYLDEVRAGLQFGSPSLGLPGSVRRSAELDGLLYTSACFDGSSPGCGTAFGGINLRGLQAVLDEYTRTARELVALAETAAGTPATASALRNSTNFAFLTGMRQVYVIESIKRVQDIYVRDLQAAASFARLLTGALLGGFLALVLAAYLLLSSRLVARLQLERRESRELLLLIPIDILNSVPALVELIQGDPRDRAAAQAADYAS